MGTNMHLNSCPWLCVTMGSRTCLYGVPMSLQAQQVLCQLLGLGLDIS
jgi:hypothetical protein